MSGTVHIKNAVIFTGNEVIEEGGVVLDGGTVVRVGKDEPPAGAGAEVIDARGRLVTPGFTIGHTHIYSAFARGLVLKGEPARGFVEILDKLWWLLDRTLTLDQVELSALLYAMDCLRSGVTTVFDHHASFGAIRGSLDVIAAALEKIGLRACLCFEVSDRAGEKAADEAIEENTDFMRKAAGGSMPLSRAMFGLHASFTISGRTMKRCAAAADPDAVGFHVHVAEDREDQERTLAEHRKRVVERLADEGILGGRTICSHCIWLEDREVELLAEAGATAAYNPQSNMNNAVGAPRVGMLRERGVDVVLGTDGFTANVLREALAGQLLQSHLEGDPTAGWTAVPSIVMEGNNALMEKFFGFGNAAVAPGRRCDLVVWDYRPPTPLTKGNFWGHAVFGLVDANAACAVVDGRIVLDEGRFTGIDEDAARKECREAAAALWKSMGGG